MFTKVLVMGALVVTFGLLATPALARGPGGGSNNTALSGTVHNNVATISGCLNTTAPDKQAYVQVDSALVGTVSLQPNGCFNNVQVPVHDGSCIVVYQSGGSKSHAYGVVSGSVVVGTTISC